MDRQELYRRKIGRVCFLDAPKTTICILADGKERVDAPRNLVPVRYRMVTLSYDWRLSGFPGFICKTALDGNATYQTLKLVSMWLLHAVYQFKLFCFYAQV